MTATHHHVLSLGAGVQSTVLALLLDDTGSSLRKLYDKPTYAVFADTGWEPTYVYDHLEWLIQAISYPIYIVAKGSIRENLRRGRNANGQHFIDVPFFMLDENGRKGMLRRQCTSNYKMRPIRRRVREELGLKPRQQVPENYTVNMLIGLSIDEATRMKPSQDDWIEHRWPLIDADMSRQDCIEWFQERFPDRYLPRSACVICPFRSDAHWLEMREQEPESFREAVEFDRRMRRTNGPVRQILDGRPYLHPSRRPLDTAIKEVAKNGASRDNHFVNECEGMCGV